MTDELSPQEQAEKDIKAMNDSLDLIKELNALSTLDEEQADTLDRNIRHLELMLSKAHIIGAGQDLSKFEALVSEASVTLRPAEENK
jgi:hypothetical protein